MSQSISYATPALLRYRHHGGGLGVLYLHGGRLAFSHGTVLHGPMTVVFDNDLAEISVAAKGHRHEPTAFVIDFDNGDTATCGFWWRANNYPPLVSGDNHAGVRVEDLDLTDRWQAEDTCASWLRILADPTAPDPKAWHPG